MRCVSVVAAALILVLELGALFGIGVIPTTEAVAAEMETVTLEAMKGGCPGGKGFCCLFDHQRLKSALEGVSGVNQVTPDKKTKTFTVVYEKGKVAFADLQMAAQGVDFEVVEARKIP